MGEGGLSGCITCRASILLALTDLSFEDSDPGEYVEEVELMNKKSAKTFYCSLPCTFVEIPPSAREWSSWRLAWINGSMS
jgi:hypothetical protein